MFWGKNCLSEEHEMKWKQQKLSFPFCLFSWDWKETKASREMTVWFLTHHLYFQVPLGSVCVWMCTGTRQGCVPLPSNNLWRKSLHALFLPSSWDSGVFNWLLWGQNLNTIKEPAIPQCMLLIYCLLFEQKVAGYRAGSINLRRG